MGNADADLNLVTWTCFSQVPFADSLGLSTDVPGEQGETTALRLDQVTWRLVEGLLSALSGRIPVSSDPAHCAEALLQCVEHTLLHWIVFGFSQDLSLGMCWEKQSQVRLAVEISLPYPSDLSP